MSKDIRKEYNGRVLIKACVQAGAVAREGKGDHVVIYCPETKSREVIPARTLGRGLQCKIIKWMLKNGLIALSLIVIWNLMF
jgi:hypothetical protein